MKQYRKLLSAVLALAVSMTLLPTIALAAVGLSARHGTAPPQFHPSRILVKPRAGVPVSQMAAIHASGKAKAIRTFDKIGNLQVVKLPEGAKVTDVIARYKRNGLVEYAEPDYMVHIDATPNDPAYLNGTLWGLHNLGQNGGTLDADIDAPEAWDTRYAANDVVVAIIDTGVRHQHEDLAANMWVNPGETAGDGIDNDGNGVVDDIHGYNPIGYMCDPITGCSTELGDPADDNGHGTHVAGTIGGVANNSIGVAGVAWNVKIMACRFLNYQGVGYTSDAIACIDYARRMGADIMNNSWGGGPYEQALADAIASVRDAGIIFVAAAGNDALDNDSYPHYPSSYDLDNIVAVAATDRNDLLAYVPGWWGSNWGLTSVDLGAPGSEIYSTYYDIYSMMETYEMLSGTSMATPHVSGALALLKARYPSEDYLGLINRLYGSVDPLASLSGLCTTGGRLNLNTALTLVSADMYVAPGHDLQFGGSQGGPYSLTQVITITNYGTASFNWTASKTQSWLTLSSTSGTLAPGASTTLTASINSTADSLPAGEYSDTITIINTTTGSGNTTRGVSLDIGRVYVSTLGSDANDGSTWMLAKRSVQAGLDAAYAGQEVWVAAGIYSECIRLKSGVRLYGGFAGTESSLSQRNWNTNLTTLDGGQAYSVVTFSAGSGNDTVIDGFTIQNGYSDPSGGGIYCEEASPTISNNVITANSANYSGGGIYCTDASPVIRGNIITANGFGAIYCDNASSPLIANNTIVANSSGMLLESFWVYDGGGIACNRSSSPTIVNNIIAYNAAGVYKDATSSPTFQNNCVYGNTDRNYSWTPEPTGSNGNISVDPKLAGYLLGNLHVQGDSPCRNAGNNSVIPSGSLDMDGQARIQGTTVDIGADESDGTTWTVNPAIIRVSPTGNDANDGSSWALAKATIQAGIDAASTQHGEVWVKSGTYVERNILLKPYAYVYGGFAGTETARTQRNWTTNVTTIDATMPPGGGTAAGVVVESAHLLGAIDGFTISNSSASGIYASHASATIANNIISNNVGSGIYLFYCSPVITGNTIRQNSGTYYGAGIYMSAANGIVSRNTISSNQANSSGGGIYVSASSAVITNNVIANNSATNRGGGVFCSQSTAKITNNTLSGNTAAILYGGGIHVELSSSPAISNNIVAYGSTGIYKDTGSTPTLRNNDVYQNSSGNYKGLTAGTGDISVDPKFVDRNSGNFHITSRSGCKDKGWNSAPALPSVDMDGQGRIYNTTVDIGADEYWP